MKSYISKVMTMPWKPLADSGNNSSYPISALHWHTLSCEFTGLANVLKQIRPDHQRVVCECSRKLRQSSEF